MTKIQITPKYSEVKPSGFYVYLHRKASDGSIFYVGKGTGRRAWARENRSFRWSRISGKNGVLVAVVQESMTEDDAFILECWLIAKLRHDGIDLCNLTDGGEGLSGHVRSDESKERTAKARRKAIETSSGEVFASAASAARFLRLNGWPKACSSTISSCAVGKNGSAYGRAWFYRGEPAKPYVAPNNKSRPVVSCRAETFKSSGEAERWLRSNDYPKAKSCRISECCRGLINRCYDRTWTYAGD